MAQKPKSTAEKPPPHTDEIGLDDRRQKAGERPRAAEPFEEGGPSGGSSGAGTEDDAKDED
jgi:hypothetical protein